MLGVGSRDQVSQALLAFCQFQRRNPNTVEIEQIEGPEAQRRAILAVIHQRPEARQAGFVTRDELAIDNRQRRRDGIDHRLQGTEAPGQIGAGAAEDRRFAVLDVHLGPPAVELDLMNPIFADGRDLRQGRRHGLDERVFTQHTADVGTKGRRCNAQRQGPLGIENFVNALIGDSVAAIRVGCKPALISGKFQRLWRNADDFNQGVGHI